MEMDVSGNTLDAAVLESIRETIMANMRRSLTDNAVVQQLLTEVFGADVAKDIMNTLGKAWDATLDAIDDIIDWFNKIPTPWRRASAFDINYSIAIPASTVTVYDGV